MLAPKDHIKPSATLESIIDKPPTNPLLEMRAQGGVDAINKWRFLKIREEEVDPDQHADTLPSHVFKEYDLESGGTLEGRNHHSSDPNKLSTRPRIAITLHAPNRPPLSGGFFEQYTGPTSATKKPCNNAEGPAKKDGYSCGVGDPHPPPFFKCQVCCRRTAFYRLKCCHLVICERCGCKCDRDDLEDKCRQSLVAKKENLPKVKLEGNDLFLWQEFSFPSSLMLCMAKRSSHKLQYYFASVNDLMSRGGRFIPVTVYSFIQDGMKVRSWYVSKEKILRKELE